MKLIFYAKDIGHKSAITTSTWFNYSNYNYYTLHFNLAVLWKSTKYWARVWIILHILFWLFYILLVTLRIQCLEFKPIILLRNLFFRSSHCAMNKNHELRNAVCLIIVIIIYEYGFVIIEMYVIIRLIFQILVFWIHFTSAYGTHSIIRNEYNL